MNGAEIELFLYLEGKHQLLAFQGMALSNGLFTDKLDKLYFKPNKTAILVEYKYFVEHYYLFYAKPNFYLKFITNTPNHDYCELKINKNALLKLITDTYEWSLNDEINQITVCSVNKQGIRGSVTEMKIIYQ